MKKVRIVATKEDRKQAEELAKQLKKKGMEVEVAIR
jgi:hypothetical protein